MPEYRLCGCIYASTEAEARIIQRLVNALSNKRGGFRVDVIEHNADGSETRRSLDD